MNGDSVAKPGAPTGSVYDLAYKRYTGGRRSPAWRIGVIARYALVAQWKRRGVKVALGLGGLLLAGFSVFAGAKWAATRAFQAQGAGALVAELSNPNHDVALMALRAQWLPTVFLVMFAGAGAIANDLKAGAFQFHFARPVQVGHYLVGRLLGAVGWASLLSLVTLTLLAALRVATGGDVAGVLGAFAAGCVGVLLRLLALAGVALGASSMTRRQGLAQTVYLGLVGGTTIVATGLSDARDGAVWNALSVVGASTSATATLLGTSGLEGVARLAPFGSSLAWGAAGLLLAWRRLRGAEVMRG